MRQWWEEDSTPWGQHVARCIAFTERAVDIIDSVEPAEWLDELLSWMRGNKWIVSCPQCAHDMRTLQSSKCWNCGYPEEDDDEVSVEDVG